MHKSSMLTAAKLRHTRYIRALENFNRVLRGVNCGRAQGRSRNRADYWWNTSVRLAGSMSRLVMKATGR